MSSHTERLLVLAALIMNTRRDNQTRDVTRQCHTQRPHRYWNLSPVLSFTTTLPCQLSPSELLWSRNQLLESKPMTLGLHLSTLQ